MLYKYSFFGVQGYMVKRVILILMIFSICTSLAFSATFDEEKIKTADGENFLFPRDAFRKGPAIFALIMSKDRENGEVQQKEVLAWQQYFNNNPWVVSDVPVYHFSVLSKVPFFVKGTIRNALFEGFVGIVDPSRVGVLFVSNTATFADQAGIPFDQESTLAVLTSDGIVAGYVKGSLTPLKLEKLQKILAEL